ncbi:RNA polymerase sigma-70 factor, ECF subfamily [Filimonas lacunae]|uniref:RNA polymerase sigma-70 factor, ECF subfamily n=2 Tax=Filimonas lacunae TaxID=477680 RepID=A0A173MDP4_9BACT|nr:RNA polymerase ECF-type sigma factor [Filimonas lacunae]SIT28905.1 RNA polymerase sigma-70 factor, ECF subfamily [Filimonas lacunae]
MIHKVNDNVLLDRLANGDEHALNEIYLLYWQDLFMCAYNVLKDKAACEDIVQDLFLQLWQKRSTIQINISLRAYLYTAVRYNVFRQIRTGKVRSVLFEEAAERMAANTTEFIMAEKEMSKQVARVVAALPDKCREVYKLSREEQLTHKEIASRLNISTKTVENQLTIALKRVRASLNTIALIVVTLLAN